MLQEYRKQLAIAGVVVLLTIGSFFVPWSAVGRWMGDASGTPDTGDYVTVRQTASLTAHDLGKALSSAKYVPLRYEHGYNMSPEPDERLGDGLIVRWNVCDTNYVARECTDKSLKDQPQVFTSSEFDGNTQQHSNLTFVGVWTRIDRSKSLMCKVPAGLSLDSRSELFDIVKDMGPKLDVQQSVRMHRTSGVWTCMPFFND